MTINKKSKNLSSNIPYSGATQHYFCPKNEKLKKLPQSIGRSNKVFIVYNSFHGKIRQNQHDKGYVHSIKVING